MDDNMTAQEIDQAITDNTVAFVPIMGMLVAFTSAGGNFSYSFQWRGDTYTGTGFATARAANYAARLAIARLDDSTDSPAQPGSAALAFMNAQVDAGAAYTWYDMVGVLRQAGASDAWIAQALDMPLIYVQNADIYLDPARDRGTNYYNEH